MLILSRTEVMKLLEKNPLFDQFTEEQINDIFDIAHFKVLNKGEYLLQEGADGNTAREVFLILKGEISIQKHDRVNRDIVYEISRIKEGECIGPIAILDLRPQEAFAVAIDTVAVMSVNVDEYLATIAENKPPLHLKVLLNLAQETAKRLRDTNSRIVDLLHNDLHATQDRAAVGSFLCNILIAASIYIFLLNMLYSFNTRVSSSTYISVTVIIIFTTAIMIFVRNSQYPPEFFGITKKNAWPAIKESMLFSLPWLFLIILIKYLLIKYVPLFAGEKIFSFSSDKGGVAVTIGSAISYGIFAPIQEMSMRGVIQSSLEHFLTGRFVTWRAIIITNIFFSISHIHISAVVVVLSFIPGLFWGWLFHRQRTVVGAAFSHFLVGEFALYVVGFIPLFTIGS